MTEKAFDPTLPRVSPDVPDDIDVRDNVSPSRSATNLFNETLGVEGQMPPPFDADTEATRPPFADAQEQALEGVRAKLSLADARVRDFVERRPIVALCGAVAAGFFIGRIVSRI